MYEDYVQTIFARHPKPMAKEPMAAQPREKRLVDSVYAGDTEAERWPEPAAQGRTCLRDVSCSVKPNLTYLKRAEGGLDGEDEVRPADKDRPGGGTK